MELNKRKSALLELGHRFIQLTNDENSNDDWTIKGKDLIERVHFNNAWFIPENVKKAFESWGNALSAENIEKWLEPYDLLSSREKKVGIIMAGNIPLVGLHDLLSVLVSGNIAVCKLSSKDNQLMAFVIEQLMDIDFEIKKYIEVVERLNNIDAIIATGSNNSVRYFEYYFSKIPHIFRKNRTSIAVLNGSETEEELKKLSDDIFDFFGLGCRNVTKIYVPEDFDMDRFFGAIFHKSEVGANNKYANNYDYNKSIYLLNKEALLENGFLLLKEDKNLFSPVAVLFYEKYSSLNSVRTEVEENLENIQCIVGKTKLFKKEIPFGKAQQPELWDYADGVDTLRFLEKL